jgi:hypothetical protein
MTNTHENTKYDVPSSNRIKIQLYIMIAHGICDIYSLLKKCSENGLKDLTCCCSFSFLQKISHGYIYDKIHLNNITVLTPQNVSDQVSNTFWNEKITSQADHYITLIIDPKKKTYNLKKKIRAGHL